MSLRRVPILTCLLFFGAVRISTSQNLNAAKLVQDLAARCAAPQAYSFDAQVQVEGWKSGGTPRLLAAGKTSFAGGPEARYSLRLEPLNKDPYVLVGNGQKSWAYVPSLKKYTETEAAASGGALGDDEDSSAGDDERDLTEVFTRALVPELARLATTTEAADIHGYSTVKYQGKKQSWPVLRAVSKADRDGSRDVTEVTLDPESFAIGRVLIARVSVEKGERTIVRAIFECSSFRLGGVPDSTFEFEPPKKTQLVEAVPIPGQSGSFLVNRPAPDFDLKTIDGERVRLADFRGRPVLLSFWASWCGPCRRELPEVARLYDRFKDKGLVVLGINDEGKGAARKFAGQNQLPFPIVDDSDGKAHRLYRIRAIPSVFVIDAQGKVVHFFVGAKSPAVLEAALKSVGL